MRKYIFGYGSLIEKESRTRSTPKAKTVFPVEVTGFTRGWFARVNPSGLTTTFLGCIEDSSKKNYVNGVIYRVDDEELSITDKRESGYDRIEIPSNDIKSLSHIDLGDAIVYIYLSKIDDEKKILSNLPNKDYPIVQSYVDICINGCIEIENEFPEAKEYEFAKKFIVSTKFWNRYWVNDRVYPRRPFIFRPTAYKIDKLLQDNLEDPSLFNKIYFE